MSENQSLEQVRSRRIVKANELIQKSRFSLSLQQQKIVLYLISQIDHFDDTDFKSYDFNIVDFCRVCGISLDCGANYKMLKEAIKGIADKSVWVTLPEGKTTLVRWIEKPTINEKSGIITIRLDEDMKPFLLNLKNNFTAYELIFTLRFKSKYSIRLYELIKSVHYHELDAYSCTYSLDELRTLLDAEKYVTYQHFKDRALTPAVTEINEYSDKNLSYVPVKTGRSVTGIAFTITSKDSLENVEVRGKTNKELGLESTETESFYDTLARRGLL